MSRPPRPGRPDHRAAWPKRPRWWSDAEAAGMSRRPTASHHSAATAEPGRAILTVRRGLLDPRDRRGGDRRPESWLASQRSRSGGRFASGLCRRLAGRLHRRAVARALGRPGAGRLGEPMPPPDSCSRRSTPSSTSRLSTTDTLERAIPVAAGTSPTDTPARAPRRGSPHRSRRPAHGAVAAADAAWRKRARARSARVLAPGPRAASAPPSSWLPSHAARERSRRSRTSRRTRSKPVFGHAQHPAQQRRSFAAAHPPDTHARRTSRPPAPAPLSVSRLAVA